MFLKSTFSERDLPEHDEGITDCTHKYAEKQKAKYNQKRDYKQMSQIKFMTTGQLYFLGTTKPNM